MRKIKKITTIALTLALSMGTCLTAFAGWEQTGTSWKYQTDGTYYSNCWQWIDSNGDGTAESYYFDEKGNMLSNAIIDDYVVNADGKWILDGVIQTKKVEEATKPAPSTTNQGNSVGGGGSSIPQPQPTPPAPTPDPAPNLAPNGQPVGGYDDPNGGFPAPPSDGLSPGRPRPGDWNYPSN